MHNKSIYVTFLYISSFSKYAIYNTSFIFIFSNYITNRSQV